MPFFDGQNGRGRAVNRRFERAGKAVTDDLITQHQNSFRMLLFYLIFIIFLLTQSCHSLISSTHKFRTIARSLQASTTTLTPNSLVQDAPIDIIIPYLSEHIQLSDQLLFVGASTNMAVKLCLLGYG